MVILLLILFGAGVVDSFTGKEPIPGSRDDLIAAREQAMKNTLNAWAEDKSEKRIWRHLSRLAELQMHLRETGPNWTADNITLAIENAQWNREDTASATAAALAHAYCRQMVGREPDAGRHLNGKIYRVYHVIEVKQIKRRSEP